MEPDEKLQEEFEKVQREIAELRKERIREYGEDRYHEPDVRINVLMCYSDIYRKYIRLKKQTFNFLLEGKSLNLESLRESYRDLASYGAMGVQIIDKMMKELDK